MGRFAALCLALGLVLAACAPAPTPKPKPEPPADKAVYSAVSFTALPGWQVDAVNAALPALRKTCGLFAKRPDTRAVGTDGIGGSIKDWRAPCAALANLPDTDPAAARAYFETWFTAYRVANNNDPKGLFTGYFEPELRGSRTPGGAYTTPLYKRPPELVMVDLGQFRDSLRGQRIAGKVENGRLKPFADREAIVAGDLRQRGLELVWVDDPVAAFFLQIQGSGRVVLEDGSILRLGYDAQNGHAYTAIGRTLIDKGALTRENVSLQSIAAWLRAHPAEADTVMNSNQSYVFFRELTGPGPLGAQGLALTPGRSLAVDRRFIPLGAPIWLDTTDPLAPEKPLQRLMVTQDTGGAIKGPVRGDVFWGAGVDAENRAGVMKQPGRYFLLLPKSVKVPGG
ncbi:MAG: murein transglycosylase A [Magnetospiraceae bacterium]